MFSPRRGPKEDALFDAVEQLDGDAVNALLKERVNVNARDVYGWTALMYATLGRDAGIMQALLDKGARVNMRLWDGRSALMIAILEGQTDLVRLLLDNGADPNIELRSGRAPLQRAVTQGHAEITRMLLDKGANPNQITKDGRSLLERAYAGGYTEIIQMLKDKGARIPSSTGIESEKKEDSSKQPSKTSNVATDKQVGNIGSKPNFSVRQGVESDLPGIADMFSRNDYGPKKEEWLRWKYLDNPDGKALMRVVEHKDGAIIGFLAQLPRRYTSAATGEIFTKQGVDMFVDPTMRGKRARHGLVSFPGGKRNFLSVSFPNRLSGLFWSRDRIIHLYNWLFPVSPGKLLAGKPYAFLGPIVDLLSKMHAFLWLGRRSNKIRMEPVKRFTNDFAINRNFIHGLRSAEYLNWRFVNNPMRAYSIYEFFEGDKSIGYCVYPKNESSAEMFDFVTNSRPKECLRLLVDHCRSEGMTHLSFKGSNLQLGMLGFFRRRSTSHCVVADSREFPGVPKGRWYLTLADSDF